MPQLEKTLQNNKQIPIYNIEGMKKLIWFLLKATTIIITIYGLYLMGEQAAQLLTVDIPAYQRQVKKHNSELNTIINHQ